VTKILGGDSLLHNKQKDPEINRGSPRSEGATTLFLLIGSSTIWGDLTSTQGMVEAAKSLRLAYPSLALDPSNLPSQPKPDASNIV
jgi:hypothetical protein